MRPLSESIAVTFIMGNGSVVHGFVRDLEGEINTGTIHKYKESVLEKIRYSPSYFIELQGIEEQDVIMVKPSDIIAFRVRHAKVKDNRGTTDDPVGYGGKQ